MVKEAKKRKKTCIHESCLHIASWHNFSDSLCIANFHLDYITCQLTRPDLLSQSITLTLGWAAVQVGSYPSSPQLSWHLQCEVGFFSMFSCSLYHPEAVWAMKFLKCYFPRFCQYLMFLRTGIHTYPHQLHKEFGNWVQYIRNVSDLETWMQIPVFLVIHSQASSL